MKSKLDVPGKDGDAGSFPIGLPGKDNLSGVVGCEIGVNLF